MCSTTVAPLKWRSPKDDVTCDVRYKYLQNTCLQMWVDFESLLAS